MNETTKSKAIWGNLEKTILTGRGIDIGCGPDPVTPSARRFDLEDGDANLISQFVNEQFDFVFSSHCLEHMHHPREAIQEWWKLVKVGGYLFFAVPDEDLYEQGVYPSLFNTDHKATFTLAKHSSWSPRSINVLDLAFSLPDAQIIKIELQEAGYDRRRMIHGTGVGGRLLRKLFKLAGGLRRKCGWKLRLLADLEARSERIDQTMVNNALAQIVCILKKAPQPNSAAEVYKFASNPA
jgi:SAM-dependent methyltransferase